MATVANTARHFALEGIESVLKLRRSPKSDQARRKLDGRTEALLIATACGPAPGGRARWTLCAKEHRTAVDWAHEIKFLADEMYPDAELITLVLDNLNTHVPGSLYKAFPPEEARRLRKRLDIHHTPKHGSWLNIAEIELNVLTRQCLDRRNDSLERVRDELSAWEQRRNQEAAKVDWQFRTPDARGKLISLYPPCDLFKCQRAKPLERFSNYCSHLAGGFRRCGFQPRN